MTRDSMNKMRLDRRLTDRHGMWKEGEYEKEAQNLPDAADKATTLGAVEAAAKAAGSEPAL